MMKKPPEKQNNSKKSLLVTVQFNPSKNDIFKWLNCLIVEHIGIHLEDKKKTKTSHILTVLFERAADGESFYKILESYSCLTISKEEA